jgi:hypothetical protein
MSKETRFFIYLLEYYAYYKGRSSTEILREWDSKNITNEIYNMYEMYHVEAIENAYADIDNLVKTGKHLW